MVARKKGHDGLGPVLHLHGFVQGFGRGLFDGQAHDHGRNQPVHQRRDKNLEKLGKLDLGFLPDHQGGDVAEGRKGATGVGGDHHVDAGQGHEFLIVPAHGHDHGPHQQRSGQVVGNGRDEKGQQAGHPKNDPQRKPPGHQVGPQRLKHVPLFHGVDVGHGGQQKKKKLGVFQQAVPDGFMGRMGVADANIGNGQQHPDNTGRQQHRFALAQVDDIFQRHQRIGQHKNGDAQVTVKRPG
jgi:hypothetical protein